MPTFTHVINTHKGMNLDYGFVLRISNVIELADYWMTVRHSKVGNALSEYLNSKEFDALTDNNTHKEHCRSQLAWALSVLCKSEASKDNPTRSVIQVLSDFMGTSFQRMSEVLNKFGTIFIQRSGGYFPFDKNMAMHKTVITETYDYPGVDRTIKITQWPNGIHWYARVGETDISDNKKNFKWNTREEAVKFTRQFLNRNNIPIPKEFTCQD